MARESGFDWIVIGPAGVPDARLPIAGSRAGAIGVLNLEFATDEDAALSTLATLVASGRGRCGVLVDGSSPLLAAILSRYSEHLDAVLVAGADPEQLTDIVASIHGAGLGAFLVATSLEEAEAGETAGFDAVIAKGDEAGGWVGTESTFILLQQCAARLRTPVWAYGGVGLHTAAACAVAGAAGAVLDSQLLLARETPLPEAARAEIRAMDGSETACHGLELASGIRVYSRPALAPVGALRQLETEFELADGDGAELRRSWRDEVRARVDWQDLETGLLTVGQDGAFAADLARRFSTVGGILAGLDAAIVEQIRSARRENPLAEGAALAQSHGTRYPIAQGPMTRVSDRAEFAAAVAEGGALPFLALALMRGPDVARLLEETKRLLGDRPWGAGILGFVPAELREEQLDAIRTHPPAFALIAGGRPDQARVLEDAGIKAYLHVPSPGLLGLYVKDGSRRFVFEGRECGGHVGPRSSFVLWDTMVRALLDQIPAGSDGSDYHVLFAGGVHDGRSAAMVAALAAPLAARGVRVGVLMGTAYLFTDEAVRAGAITTKFQQAAVAGTETALLETSPGHATRCLSSPFVDEFREEKRRLRREDTSHEELRNRLELMNLGRLRIAAKGVDRHSAFGQDANAPKLVALDDEEQWLRGMFMIGEVATLMDEVTTVAELHRALVTGSDDVLAALPLPERLSIQEPALPPADVAIVGLGSILPGAADVRSFWANIVNKVDAVTEIPASRWDWREYYDPDRNARDKVYSKWGGFIDPVPFDPVAFGMPPNSLRSIEPFQLLGLLVAEAALRDAGYADRPFPRERTSVILGAGGGGADLSVGYTVRSTLPKLLGADAWQLTEDLGAALPEWTEDSFAGILMNVAAGRIANRLDLGGTNYTVDAACASSLAAIAHAVRELQTGTSDMVLTGGIDAIQNPFGYLCFCKTQALSPNGRCRPFDAEADGIAISEGFATIVLKRLADAERDGDRIYAIIKGVGSASDGRDRSLTAPRPEGQMRALRRAYAHAGVSPATVGLVEAHGTGTVAGDRAEVEALSTVFAEAGSDRQAVALGSVKSMIGHTKATAGVAGLVKATLALHNRVLPPTIGVTKPNPRADFAESPFYVNTETRPWLRGVDDSPRRAGVSAFGFGGTDFHIVLEEYTGEYLANHKPTLDPWPAELFLFRGDSRAGVLDAAGALASELRGGAEPALADLAYTLATEANRRQGGATLAIVADSLSELAKRLDAAPALIGSAERVHLPDGFHYSERPLASDGKVAFLFPGQGSQYVNMGRELAVVFPEVREQFERSDRVLADLHEQPLSRYVFPPPVFDEDDEKRLEASLTDTHVAQPALGAMDLGCLHVLRSFGVEPELVAGHSYGEFVALAAAGSISEDDLLLLSEARGRFIREEAGEEPGSMAAIEAAPEALEGLLAEVDVVIANVNAPLQTVVSGSRAAIEAAVAWCTERDVRARRLPVACAFHSSFVEPAQRRLAEMLRKTQLASPRIPVYSNTTAGRYPDDPAAIAEILGEHLIRPVEFSHEVGAMYDDGARIFVEVGPRSVLTGLVGRILGEHPHLAIPVDQTGRGGLTQLLHCLAALAAEGVALQPERLFDGRAVVLLAREGLEPVGGRPPVPPALWLVDGGSARPANATAQQAPSAKQPDPAEPQVDGMDMNTSDTNHGHVSRFDTAPPVQPAPAAAANAAPSGERVGDVMNRHLQLMQHFLDTQKAVVLTYLGQARGGEAPIEHPAQHTVEHASGNGKVDLPLQAFQPPPLAAPPPVLPVPEAPPVQLAPPVVEAAPPPSPVPVAATNGHVPAAALDIAARLLEIVSERTGYPREMLELDADLEADLGIDSIKRVEIVGTMIQSLTLADGVTPDVEELTSTRTLRDAIAALEALSARGAGGDASPAALALVEGEPSPFDDARAEKPESARAHIGRYTVAAAAAPPPSGNAGFATDGAVVIVDDGVGVGLIVAERLRARGDRVVRLMAHAADAAGVDDLWIGDLADLEVGSRLAVALAERGDTAKALVHLAALDPSGDRDGGGDRAVTSLFLLARALGADLEHAGETGGAAVLGASALGGSFGIDDYGASRPGHGAIAGFLKSLAQEWPAVRVKAVDLEPTDPVDVADALLAELLADDGLVEVGYRNGTRMSVELRPRSTDDDDGELPLTSDSVVLITGGARGITAEVAALLAERAQPTLVLVGRTPAPEGEEDEQTASLTEPRALRQAIIESAREAGRDVTPAIVEAEYRRLIAAREVRESLARLRGSGARIEYRACDVRDGEAFGALIDDVYERHGRIDGVVHGAGVIEDKLVRDKELGSFARVLGTKAGAARTLAAKLRPETLAFLVFFGSVSGRFGNRGQADYAAASEILNKLAHELDRRWPARVVSIDWGPWLTTGMVSPALQEEFERRGVVLIPIDEGCRLFEQELRNGRKGEAEVVIGGATGLAGAALGSARPQSAPLPLLTGASVSSSDGAVQIVRSFDLERDVYLGDHRIDGRPIFPFAGAMELMAEAAVAANPGLELAGMRDIRVLKGVTVDEAGYAVRVSAVPARPDGTSFETTISGLENDRPHYRSIVDLRHPGAAADATVRPSELPDLPAFPMTVEDAYRDLLFHGPLFQRIDAIEGMDERGASAVLLPSDPAVCIRGAEGAWLLDPVLVDSALQMQVIWARLNWDATLLPAMIGGFVSWATPTPDEPVRHELRIRPESVLPLCHCDHYFYGADGRLLATMTNVQGIASKALNRLAGVVG